MLQKKGDSFAPWKICTLSLVKGVRGKAGASPTQAIKTIMAFILRKNYWTWENRPNKS